MANDNPDSVVLELLALIAKQADTLGEAVDLLKRQAAVIEAQELTITLNQISLERKHDDELQAERDHHELRRYREKEARRDQEILDQVEADNARDQARCHFKGLIWKAVNSWVN